MDSPQVLIGAVEAGGTKFVCAVGTGPDDVRAQERFDTTLPLPPLLLIYAITCALQTIGPLLFWQLAGPGVAGLLGMGVMLAWAYARRAALRVTMAEAN